MYYNILFIFIYF